jgi:hypothetical protein
MHNIAIGILVFPGFQLLDLAGSGAYRPQNGPYFGLH